jgi:hypothetical protein
VVVPAGSPPLTCPESAGTPAGGVATCAPTDAAIAAAMTAPSGALQRLRVMSVDQQGGVVAEVPGLPDRTDTA